MGILPERVKQASDETDVTRRAHEYFNRLLGYVASPKCR
jgi:hypothetical protein